MSDERTQPDIDDTEGHGRKLTVDNQDDDTEGHIGRHYDD